MSLFGHIKTFLVNRTQDPGLQDIEIVPAKGQEPMVSRGYADWIDDIGPVPVTVTAKVVYPRTGAPVDYWDLHINGKPVECAFIDVDGKRGRLLNGRVMEAPRTDPQKGARTNNLKISGWLAAA